MGACDDARHNLGAIEGKGERGPRNEAFYLAARAGDAGSLELMQKGLSRGLVTKDSYKKSLRMYEDSICKMKSKQRDKGR